MQPKMVASVASSNSARLAGAEEVQMRLAAFSLALLEVRLTDEEILADLLYPEAPRPAPPAAARR